MATLKVIKKTYTGNVTGVTSANTTFYVMGIAITANVVLTDLVGRNVADFLTECGREDVRYDEESHCLFISGAPIVLYAIAGTLSSTTPIAIGIFSFGVGIVAPKVDPTTSTTTALPTCGTMKFNATTGIYEMCLRFVGSNKGAFCFSFARYWQRGRSSTSSTSWYYSWVPSPVFDVLGSVCGVSFGKNFVSGNKVVIVSAQNFVSFCDVTESGEYSNDYFRPEGSTAATVFSIGNNGMRPFFSEGLKKEKEEGRIALIPFSFAITGTYFPVVPEVYYQYSGMPNCTGVFSDSQVVLDFEGKTYWVQNSFSTLNATYSACWFPIVEVID